MSVLSKEQVEDRLMLVAENRATAVAQREILASHESLRASLAASEAEVAKVSQTQAALDAAVEAREKAESDLCIALNEAHTVIAKCDEAEKQRRDLDALYVAAMVRGNKAEVRAEAAERERDEWKAKAEEAHARCDHLLQGRDVLQQANDEKLSALNSARDGERRAREALKNIRRCIFMQEEARSVGSHEPDANIVAWISVEVDAALTPHPLVSVLRPHHAPWRRAWKGEAMTARWMAPRSGSGKAHLCRLSPLSSDYLIAPCGMCCGRLWMARDDGRPRCKRCVAAEKAKERGR